MKRLLQALMFPALALASFAGALSDSEGPVSYTLQLAQNHVDVGQNPQIRISVFNSTPRGLDFNPDIYLSVDGPGGHQEYPIKFWQDLAQHVIVAPGQSAYIWGSASTWYSLTLFMRFIDARPGHYMLRYCGYWREGNRLEPVCSNRVRLVVGHPDGNEGGEGLRSSSRVRSLRYHR